MDCTTSATGLPCSPARLPGSPAGLFLAHLDPESIRWADGSSAARPVLAALRAVGFTYDARHHRLALRGPCTVHLPFRHLGADPMPGPTTPASPPLPRTTAGFLSVRSVSCAVALVEFTPGRLAYAQWFR
ncbi:hypothetical protein NKH18_49785 [Streptomyces sp. M10(2022)]